MDLHSLSSSLWGFSAMECPLEEIPVPLLEAVRERLWTSDPVRKCDGPSDPMRGNDGRTSDPVRGSDGLLVNDQHVEIDSITSTGDIDSDRLEEISDSDGGVVSGEEDGVIKKTVRQQQSSRAIRTALEEGGLSLSLGLEAMASLQATLSPEEIKAVSQRLESLSPHMIPDTIVSCLAGLSGLGLIWTTDLAVDTRQTFLSRLKRSPRDLNDAKRKSLAESLKKMQAT